MRSKLPSLATPAVRRSSAADDLATGSRETLSWNIRSDGRLIVIVLEGELDASTASWLGERVPSLDQTGRHLIVDLAALRLCEHAGLSLFLRWQARAIATAGSLHLVAVPPGIRRLIMLTGLQHVLQLAADLADAIAAIDRENVTFPRPR